MSEMDEKSLDLISKQIEIILSSLGMSEQYIAFHYLHAVIFHMIINNDDSIRSYRTAIHSLMDKYEISNRTIGHGLHKQ